MTQRKHDTENFRREVQRLRAAESKCTCADVLAQTRERFLEILMAEAGDEVRAAIVEIKRVQRRMGYIAELGLAISTLERAVNVLAPTAVIESKPVELTAEQILECEG